MHLAQRKVAGNAPENAERQVALSDFHFGWVRMVYARRGVNYSSWIPTQHKHTNNKHKHKETRTQTQTRTHTKAQTNDDTHRTTVKTRHTRTTHTHNQRNSSHRTTCTQTTTDNSYTTNERDTHTRTAPQAGSDFGLCPQRDRSDSIRHLITVSIIIRGGHMAYVQVC